MTWQPNAAPLPPGRPFAEPQLCGTLSCLDRAADARYRSVRSGECAEQQLCGALSCVARAADARCRAGRSAGLALRARGAGTAVGRHWWVLVCGKDAKDVLGGLAVGPTRPEGALACRPRLVGHRAVGVLGVPFP